MSEDNKIYRYLEVIERSVNLIREELGKGCVCNRIEDHVISWICSIHGQVNRSEQVKQLTTAKKVLSIPSMEPLAIKAENKAESEYGIEELRKKHIEDLMNIDCWPEAVSARNICNNEDRQVKRAKAILDWIVDPEDLKDIKFLDFGCGAGWTTKEMVLRGPNLCVGYDVQSSDNWHNQENLEFTNDFDKVKQHKYDIIFIFDVLDHCHDPVVLMTSLKTLLNPKGKIYIRCHPFFAKHGSHLHEKGLNKSYIHLFLKQQELVSIGYEPPFFTRVEVNPLEAYRWWFHDYKIVKEHVIKNDVHEFFLTQSFKELLAQEHHLDQNELNLFLENMQIDFVDYILTL